METTESCRRLPEKLEERRQFPRYDCSFRVNYATEDSVASLESYSIAKNISKGGMRMLVSRLVRKGSSLRIRIFNEDETEPVEARGRVRWVNEELAASSLIIDAGIQFVDANPSEVDELLASLQ